MTEQPTVWRATGLYWTNGIPGLGLADPAGAERTHPVPTGTEVGYQLDGQRRCIGIWLAQQKLRSPCPFGHPIPPHTTTVQCTACSAVDPGQQLARTAPDDGRTYALYLAWFGPGLTKVGLTAVDRGGDRLAEQGALAFTWLAHGRLPAVRSAEQAISSSRLAAERRQRTTKLAAWWRMPDQTERAQQLAAAYQHIVETVSWPDGLHREPCQVIDQVTLYGLDALPDSCQEVTGLQASSVLRGIVQCAVGRELLLDTPNGPLLIDTRRLAGWTVHPTTAACAGLELRACDYARRNDDSDQTTLF